MGLRPWKLLLISLLTVTLGCGDVVNPLLEKSPAEPNPPKSPAPTRPDPPQDESGADEGPSENPADNPADNPIDTPTDQPVDTPAEDSPTQEPDEVPEEPAEEENTPPQTDLPEEQEPAEEDPVDEEPTTDMPTEAICKDNERDAVSTHWKDLLKDLQGIERIPRASCLWVFAEFAQIHLEIAVDSHRLHGVQNALRGLCRKGENIPGNHPLVSDKHRLKEALSALEEDLLVFRGSQEFKSCTKKKEKEKKK